MNRNIIRMKQELVREVKEEKIRNWEQCIEQSPNWTKKCIIFLPRNLEQNYGFLNNTPKIKGELSRASSS